MSGTHQQAECQRHSQALLHTREKVRQTRPRQSEDTSKRANQLQGTASYCIVSCRFDLLSVVCVSQLVRCSRDEPDDGDCVA